MREATQVIATPLCFKESKKQVIKSGLSGLVTFATAAAIWMWGYSVGEGKSEALTGVIKEERDSLRIEVNKISEEAESLKFQLLSSREKLTISANTDSPTSTTETIQSKLDNATNSQISGAHESQEISISTQNTGSFFNGEIEVTVIATNYTGIPP